MNRTANQFGASFTKGVIDVTCRVAVGGTGAVTLQTWNPTSRTYATAGSGGNLDGVKSVVRNSTGNWTVTFGNSAGFDSYQRCFWVNFIPEVATTGISAAATVGIIPGGTNVNSNTAPAVNIAFADYAGAAVDPASGEKIYLLFRLQNSSAL